MRTPLPAGRMERSKITAPPVFPAALFLDPWGAEGAQLPGCASSDAK